MILSWEVMYVRRMLDTTSLLYLSSVAAFERLQSQTHALPRMKMPQTPIFCCSEIRRFQSIGSGRIRTAPFSKVLMVAKPTSAGTRSMHSSPE